MLKVGQPKLQQALQPRVRSPQWETEAHAVAYTLETLGLESGVEELGAALQGGSLDAARQ